ncbi:MAG: hypothetical protein NC204_06970 [Candidatus Amulumruptor caecigallinarius]|nr:hypothetical protein [Candidatus Amulumruptor caecigallinarius]
MKKYSILSLAALGLLTVSCSNTDMPGGSSDEVTFSIEMPAEAGTRGFSDGKAAQTLKWAIYDSTTGEVVLTVDDSDAPGYTYGDLNFTITYNLVKGKTYDFVFWADNNSGNYELDYAGKKMTVKYPEAGPMLSDNDNYDAFYNVVKGVKVTGSASLSTKLRRPFAQINLGTDDIALAATYQTTVSTVEMTVSGAYTVLDLFSGKASSPVSLKFGAAPVPEGETFPVEKDGKSYDYLAMGYVLTGIEVDKDNVQSAQQELMSTVFTLTFKDGQKNSIEVPNMPVQRNYRTNVYGSLITSPIDWTIEIAPDFNGPDHNLEQ